MTRWCGLHAGYESIVPGRAGAQSKAGDCFVVISRGCLDERQPQWLYGWTCPGLDTEEGDLLKEVSVLKRLFVSIIAASAIAIVGATAAFATPSPNGPGQPGAPNTTCSTFTVTPGSSVSAQGSAYNPSGTAGTVYAGNPGTASLANANSPHAVSQYDIACFQLSTH